MTYKKRLKVLDANNLYLIGAILFFTIGFYFQKVNLELGLLITQYFLILLPPIIYLLIKKLPVKKTLRLNKIRIKHCLLIVFITILMYPVAVFANTVLMILLSLMGNLNIPQLPTATNTSQYILLMFIISLSAGICEEVFFRGFILSGYENLGTKKAIIISSVLFGIFHFNLYNLLGPIVLGLVFSYLVILTNSLYAGIIGHIVNNGFAVTLGFLMNIFSDFLIKGQDTGVEIPTLWALFISAIFFGTIAMVTGFIALKLMNIIRKDVIYDDDFIEENNFYKECTKYEDKTQDFVPFREYIPLLLVVPLYIMTAFIQIREIINLS